MAHPTRTNTLNITGEAKARGTIDLATITCSVISKDADGKYARKDNNNKMTGVFAVLEGLGIDKRDYQTVGYSYADWYEYEWTGKGKERRQENVLKGKQVVNSLAITLRDISKLDALLDSLAEVGVTSIGDPKLTVSNPGVLMNEARKGAIANALAKAKLYADAAGVEILALSSLSERSAQHDESRYVGKTMVMNATCESADDAPGASVNAGSSQLAVTVNCTFVVSDIKKNIFGKTKKVANKRRRR